MHLDHPHLVGIAASAHSDCGAEDIKLFENSGRLARQHGAAVFPFALFAITPYRQSGQH